MGVKAAHRPAPAVEVDDQGTILAGGNVEAGVERALGTADPQAADRRHRNPAAPEEPCLAVDLRPCLGHRKLLQARLSEKPGQPDRHPDLRVEHLPLDLREVPRDRPLQ